MVEDLGAGFDDEADGFLVALKVGDEDFDLTAGSLAANFIDHHDEGAGATDNVIVAIDAGDDGKLEAEGSDGFGDAAGLVEVDGLGAAFGDGAESAAAGAEVAEHHEGGGVVVPALADVGALRGFADGVEVEGARQLFEVVVVVAHGCAGAEPLGFGERAARREVDLD